MSDLFSFIRKKTPKFRRLKDFIAIKIGGKTIKIGEKTIKIGEKTIKITKLWFFLWFFSIII